MDVALIAVGLALVLVGLYDMFRTLFLPAGKGMVSKWVAIGVWRFVRKLAVRRPAILTLAGPFAFVATVLTWGFACFTLGFALIYWSQMPARFSYSPGLIPSENDGFLDAWYVSVVTLATLGFGDITPMVGWLRLLAPLQALIGFLLWTAGISWLLSIHPDISSRQVFAREVSLMRESELLTSTDVTSLPSTTSPVVLLDRLVAGVVNAESDLVQFPVTYYFHTTDESSSLPSVLPYVLDVANRASRPDRPDDIRLQGMRLHGALDDLAATLGKRFLFVEDGSTKQVFDLYLQDHSPGTSRSPVADG